MTDRQLIGAAFISGIHGLWRIQVIGNLLLRHVVVLTQIAQPLDIIHRIALLARKNTCLQSLSRTCRYTPSSPYTFMIPWFTFWNGYLIHIFIRKFIHKKAAAAIFNFLRWKPRLLMITMWYVCVFPPVSPHVLGTVSGAESPAKHHIIFVDRAEEGFGLTTGIHVPCHYSSLP